MLLNVLQQSAYGTANGLRLVATSDGGNCRHSTLCCVLCVGQLTMMVGSPIPVSTMKHSFGTPCSGGWQSSL